MNGTVSKEIEEKMLVAAQEQYNHLLWCIEQHYEEWRIEAIEKLKGMLDMLSMATGKEYAFGKSGIYEGRPYWR